MPRINIDALAHLTLGHGSGGPDLCLLEATAWIAGERRTDHPACVAPSLIEVGIRLNDWADDEQRQTLKAFVPRLIGTAGDAAAEERRAYLAIDAAIREFAPLWMERAGLAEWAERLRALPEIADAAGAAAGRVLVIQAQDATPLAANAAYAAADAAANAAAAAYAAVYAAANAANAANAAVYAAEAAAEMGMWNRLRDLFDRMIRAGETPLDAGHEDLRLVVIADRAAIGERVGA